MTQAQQGTVDLLTEYYAAMEAKDLATCRRYYTDDMTVTFANNPVIEGADTFVATLGEMLGRVQSVHHKIRNAWESDGDQVVFESDATWTLRNGAQLSIPACSVCTLVDGKFTEQRIYVDNAPLAAAIEASETAM